MSTDFRALCAELLMALENAISIIYCEDGTKHISTAKPIVNRARAALADEPAAPKSREWPSDEELLDLHDWMADEWAANHDAELPLSQYARAVLARWGTSNLTQTWRSPADGEVAKSVAWLRQEFMRNQQIGNRTGALQSLRAAELLERQMLVPVPVGVRPPGPEDCDAAGRCWWHRYTPTPEWHLRFGRTGQHNHWLPAHALPLPEVGE